MAGRRVYFDGAGAFDHADDDPLDPAARGLSRDALGRGIGGL